MSGIYPTTKKPTLLNFISNRPTTVNYTLSGKRSVKLSASQYFSFTVTMPPMKRSDFMEYYSFLVKQKGSFETFTFTSPLSNQGAVDSNDTVLVNGVHAVGDTTIAMDAFAGDGAGRVKAGDFIKFGGHTKVYMVVSDVTSSSNAATVTIEPPLTTALSDNDTVVYDSVPFTVALSNDIQEFGIPSDAFFRYEMKFIEVI